MIGYSVIYIRYTVRYLKFTDTPYIVLGHYIAHRVIYNIIQSVWSVVIQYLVGQDFKISICCLSAKHTSLKGCLS